MARSRGTKPKARERKGIVPLWGYRSLDISPHHSGNFPNPLDVAEVMQTTEHPSIDRLHNHRIIMRITWAGASLNQLDRDITTILQGKATIILLMRTTVPA